MLASDQYKQELSQLHEQTKFGQGVVTAKHYPLICELVIKKKCSSILDYGCGKGHFLDYASQKLEGVKAEGFDVANSKYSLMPHGQFDMVTCLDVLEHIEYGFLSNVLHEIQGKTKKYFFCSIANYPAGKKLSDGRNAHLIQVPFGYWFTTLSTFFRVDRFHRSAFGEGVFICTPLTEKHDWR
jgi:2-polyprenyl-3-methyl-5-hydroxy-6-metoxy-1,4-benzoquinol methylase